MANTNRIRKAETNQSTAGSKPAYDPNEIYVKILKWLIYDKRLTLPDFRVISCQIDHLGKGKVCNPGIRTIAREIGIDKSTVHRSIKHLCSLGLESRYKVRTRKGWKNHYILKLHPVRAKRTTPYAQSVHNYTQLTRTDPNFEDSVGQKAGAKRETPREKVIRKSTQETISRREQRKQAKGKAKQHKTTNPPDKEVNHGTE